MLMLKTIVENVSGITQTLSVSIRTCQNCTSSYQILAWTQQILGSSVLHYFSDTSKTVKKNYSETLLHTEQQTVHSFYVKMSAVILKKRANLSNQCANISLDLKNSQRSIFRTCCLSIAAPPKLYNLKTASGGLFLSRKQRFPGAGLVILPGVTLS